MSIQNYDFAAVVLDRVLQQIIENKKIDLPEWKPDDIQVKPWKKFVNFVFSYWDKKIKFREDKKKFDDLVSVKSKELLFYNK